MLGANVSKLVPCFHVFYGDSTLFDLLLDEEVTLSHVLNSRTVGSIVVVVDLGTSSIFSLTTASRLLIS